MNRIIDFFIIFIKAATMFFAFSIIRMNIKRDNLSANDKLICLSGWCVSILYIFVSLLKDIININSKADINTNPVSLIILTIVLLFGFYMLFRNNHTYNVSKKSLLIITAYLHYLIDNELFDPSINYYTEMRYSYSRYLFSIFTFNVINIIKPKYRREIKDFMETDYFKEFLATLDNN